MAGFSRYLQQELLDHFLKTGAYTPPTHVYVALFTAAPSDTGGGTECTGTGYVRVICDVWNAATAASPSVADNTGIIDFGSAGAGDWGTITHLGLFDALTGVNLLGWVALTTPKTINNGDPVTFPAGALDVSLD
jgi:hypothetical protein